MELKRDAAFEERLRQILELDIRPGTFMADLIKAEPLPFFRTDRVQYLGILLEGTALGPSELQEGDTKPRGGATGV